VHSVLLAKERLRKESGAMRYLVSLAVLTVAFAAGPTLAADSVVGTWNTIDDRTGKVESMVEIYEQGAKLFGKITGLTEPNDAQGKPKTCTKCTGADKGKPIIGLVILKDLGRSGDRYKGGTITDPHDGKVYKAEVWVEDGKLKVRGYRGLVYKTKTWIKAS
jgi:uncharacterized protein (DUF2147 family)